MKIADYTKEQVEAAAANSTSIKEFIVTLGLVPNNGQYRRAKSIANYFNITLPKFDYTGATKNAQSTVKIDDSTYFARNTNRHGPRIAKRLIEDFGWTYSCSMANCPSPKPVWNGKPLVLQVDHIDGDHTNNLIENLRLVCPNCHTQTDTYSNKARALPVVV